jgi:hypothetical protein
MCCGLDKTPCKTRQQQQQKAEQKEAAGDTAGVVRSRLPSGRDVVRQARLSCKTAAHSHLVVAFVKFQLPFHQLTYPKVRLQNEVQSGH